MKRYRTLLRKDAPEYWEDLEALEEAKLVTPDQAEHMGFTIGIVTGFVIGMAYGVLIMSL